LIEWWQYLRQGLNRKSPLDRLAEESTPERDRANLNNLRPFVGRHMRKAIIGALLILASTLLAFPQPLITRYLIDHVILGKQLNQLFVVVLIIVLVKGFSMLAGPLQNYYFTRFEEDVMVDLQSDLVARTLKLPKSFLDEQQTGYLMSRLGSDVQGLRWFFSSTLVYLATNVLRFIGGVIFLFYLEWRLALVTLVALPGIVMGMKYFSKILRNLNMHSMEKEGTYWERLQESLSATTLIKSFSTEAEERERVISQLKDIRQITMETTTVNALANLILDILPDASRAVVLILGAYWIIQGNWTLGSLLAFQNYLGYVFGPAYSLANVNIQLQSALGALQRVSAIYNIIPEEHGKGIQVEHLKGEIEFANVSFSYNSKEMVLENISFKIRDRKSVV
jgi:ABC-type bacteriocin/lantibiotic exporter with double-glycine peptidase domain